MALIAAGREKTGNKKGTKINEFRIAMRELDFLIFPENPGELYPSRVIR